MISIKNIFLPEKIRDTRVLAQRILGIAINEDDIYATLIYTKRSGSTVEALFHEHINDTKAPKDELLQTALKKITSQAKQVDQIRLAIPSSMVIFKELIVPFTDNNKIRMVLDYEIEPMLPFSLDDAVIDFIITQENKAEKSSQIIVAAVRNQDLQVLLDQCTAADIEPTCITIDLFAHYGLFQQISEYKALEGGSAIVHLGLNSMEISFIEDGKLRLRRYVPRGIMTIVQEIADESKISQHEILGKLFRNGFEASGDNEYDKIVKKHTIDFFNDIQFTLNSFSLKLNYYKGVHKILFMGNALKIPNLTRFATDVLQIPSEIFEPEKVFKNKSIKNKVKKRPESWHFFTTALGAAIVAHEQENFNLRRKMFTLSQHQLITKQLITGSIIFVGILAFFGINGYLTINKISTLVMESERKEAKKLLALIPPKDQPKGFKLNQITKKAEEFIKEQSQIWAPFEKNEVEPLEILLELTSIMDKNLFTIECNTVSITEQAGSDQEGKKEIIIEVSGYFKSNKGIGLNFGDFQELVKRFEASSFFEPTEPLVGRPAEERGVQFTFHLKKKEV
jgi:type IV pilus assembly protein PilM